MEVYDVQRVLEGYLDKCVVRTKFHHEIIIEKGFTTPCLDFSEYTYKKIKDLNKTLRWL